MKKINFKQPKYILPAVLFVPILFVGWMVVGMVSMNVKEENKAIVKEEINTDMPDPNMDNESMTMRSKYQNMMNDFGKIKDYAAVQGLEEETKMKYDEAGNSLYSDSEIAMLDSLEQEKQKRLKELNNMQQQTLEMVGGNNNYISQNEYNNTPKNNNREDNKQKDEFAEQMALLQKIANGESLDEEPKETRTAPAAVVQQKTAKETEEVHKVEKVNVSHFNTIQSNKEASSRYIKAMLDESLKATDGSRLRIRLLDDIEVDGNVIPKGSYLYALVTGFEAQRIKASVTSIMIGNTHLSVSLNIYDNDGLEGFYIPASAFRELQKEIGSQALSQNMNMNQGAGEQSLQSTLFQTLQNVYQSTTSAVSNNIRKNKAKLKYNTVVYLINKNNQ